LRFRQDFWQHKSRVPGLSYGILCLILGLAIFVELRQMDGQTTDGHTTTAYAALA